MGRLPLGLLVLLGACGDDGGGGAGQIDVTCEADTQDRSGEATYYTFADGSGACSFDPTPNDLMVGAMNQVDYLGSEACGACAEVNGPNGVVQIRIVDLCPECPQGNIDLSPQAFEAIADLTAGRVPITWHYVSCPYTSPIRYHFKDGSNQWWTAVQLRNHVNRVARLEVGDGTTFSAVARLDYNYFVAETGLGPGPYTFRVTDVHGHTVEDLAIAHLENADVEGSGQLPACAP